MRAPQAGYVTPRAIVRRNQAAALLAALARRGLSVTPARLELHAVARYAGELSYRMIQEVVAVALKLHARSVARAVPAPSALTPRPDPAHLSGEEIREIIRRELRRRPNALSPDIRRAVEEAGPLGIQPQSFPPLVSRIRHELGLPKIATGRPRRVA